MPSKVFYALLLVALWFGSKAQTLVNGGFEDWPDSCLLDSPPVGWDNFDDGGPDQRGIYCMGSIIPYEGDSYMSLLWGSGGIFRSEGASQKVTNLTVGQSYRVSFYAIPCDYYGYNEPINILVYLDSIRIYITPEIHLGDPWTHFFTDFTATDTEMEIALQAKEFDQGSSSFASLGVDDLTITKAIGIAETKSYLLEVFPNPVADFLYITSSHEAETIIHIVDTKGQIVLCTSLAVKAIDVSSLKPGLYFIYTDANRLNGLKFIKY